MRRYQKADGDNAQCSPFVHWSVPDPATEGPNDRATYPAFERTADELETRIGFLLQLLEPSTRRSTHAKR